MYPRYIKTRIAQLLSEFRIVYLTGPRQAGKTTLATAIAEKNGMAYHTLDDSGLLLAARTDPQGLLAALPRPMVLEEFQLAPELVRAIKQISDSARPDQKGLFLLTGSADIFKSAKTQEGLPGHMATVQMLPLSQGEVRAADRFDMLDWLFGDDLERKAGHALDRHAIAHVLICGGYPEVQSMSPRSRSVWFASYLSGRLLKDFEAMYDARGDYPSKLNALTHYLAGLSGNLLKFAAVSNALKQDDKTVKRYTEVLDHMFIVARLPSYVRSRTKRNVIGLPKVYFIDTGLACHLLGYKKPAVLYTSSHYGALLETFVAMECTKQTGWAEDDYRLWHFRDRGRNEVDLVVENSAGKIVGLEVKASATVRSEDFTGLAHLKTYAGADFHRGVVLYAGADLLPIRIAGQRFHAVPLSYLGRLGASAGN